MENKPNQPPQPKPVVGVYRRSHVLRTLMILIVVAIVGIGVYRQWFVVTTHDRDDDNKVDLKLTVDKAKIEADTKMAVKKTEEEASKLSTKVKEEASKLQDHGK
jgi:Tfp pilus assembly protein PilX